MADCNEWQTRAFPNVSEFESESEWAWRSIKFRICKKCGNLETQQHSDLDSNSVTLLYVVVKCVFLLGSSSSQYTHTINTHTYIHMHHNAIYSNLSLESESHPLLAWLFIAALWNRAGHYIFALWFISIFLFSSPNLSGYRLDVYHTSTHDVALLRI